MNCILCFPGKLQTAISGIGVNDIREIIDILKLEAPELLEVTFIESQLASLDQLLMETINIMQPPQPRGFVLRKWNASIGPYSSRSASIKMGRINSMSKSKRQSYGRQPKSSNLSAFSKLLHAMNLISSIMMFLMFPYVYYVKIAPIFLVITIFIAFPWSIYLYFSGRKILKNIKNDFHTYKGNYILFFIWSCLSIVSVIIVLLGCN